MERLVPGVYSIWHRYLFCAHAMCVSLSLWMLMTRLLSFDLKLPCRRLTGMTSPSAANPAHYFDLLLLIQQLLPSCDPPTLLTSCLKTQCREGGAGVKGQIQHKRVYHQHERILCWFLEDPLLWTWHDVPCKADNCPTQDIKLVRIVAGDWLSDMTRWRVTWEWRGCWRCKIV